LFSGTSLAQTPKTTSTVLPSTTPTPVTNYTPSTQSDLNQVPVNLLQSQIQNLESKINQLESQSGSFNLIPLVLSAVGGGVLGAFLVALFLTLKRPKNNPRKCKSASKEVEPTQDQTTQYLNATISHLSTNVKQLTERIKSVENQLSTFQLERSSYSSSQIDLSDEEITPDSSQIRDRDSVLPKLKLIDMYHQDPDRLILKGIEVSETEESISNRLFSTSNAVVLENRRHGDYLIVKETKVDYLVPQPNLNINESNYSSVEALFECHNYSPTYSDFKLVKPARVLGILGGINWCLEKKGILEFYVDSIKSKNLW
jgi:outer membrane murein-binding lipoprotein Lpp